MIQKLRRKFILTNMALVSLVLLAVFSVQTFSSFQRAREQVYHAQLTALNGITRSSKPDFVFGKPPSDGRSRGFPSIPSFAVEIDDEHHIIALQTVPGVSVTQETAQSMVDQALSQPSGHGNLPGQNLSYLFRLENDRMFLVFADNSSIGTAVRNQVVTSLLICAAALLAFYLISRFLAKLSLRPVEQAWNQQRQFVADASHELKTPVTVILANTGIVLSHPQDTVEQQSKWITYIQDEARQMKSLVDDLLFLAKSDVSRTAPISNPVCFSDLVTGSILPFESVAFENGVTLTEQISPGLTLSGDEEQLRRLVVILLDNAVKYAGEKGLVTVKLEEIQGKVCLSVHNTGPAIPEEHLPHLFERFYRSDASRNRDHGGYGLGLAIAKSIVDAHGGKIAVTSTPADGTAFTVTFPKK